MPTGAIWCSDCGYQAPHKEQHNPFLVSVLRSKLTPLEEKEALNMALGLIGEIMSHDAWGRIPPLLSERVETFIDKMESAVMEIKE